MKASATATAPELTVSSNRRQPVRQTRTNPARNASNGAGPFGGRGARGGSPEDRSNSNGAPGFFPAITHFSDCITALPKEVVRHYTMLKEVDAKIYGPEDALKQIVSAGLKAPVPPPRNSLSQWNTESNSRIGTNTNSSCAGSVNGATVPAGQSQEGTLSQTEGKVHVDIADLPRRRLFYHLRAVAGEMLTFLDEKNHVMSTATDALEKQLARCESSYPHIENEISEEARLGNLHHWAYMDKTTEKKGTTAGERTRREAAVANNLAVAAALTQEGELAAMRSEARREAIAAKKQRIQHVDSDFDDGRTTKKAIGTGKGRKIAEAAPQQNGTGTIGTNASINAGLSGPNKRRKVEKVLAGGGLGALVMERSLSSVFGPSATISRRAGSPGEAAGAEQAKKRGRAGTLTNGNNGRRRAGTAASAVNSPSMASSPLVGTFAAASKVGNSPALGALQRSQSTRGRQNSTNTSSIPDMARNRPPAVSIKQTNGHGTHITPTESSSVSRSTGESKPTSKDSIPSKSEETLPSADMNSRTTSRSHDRTTLKKEEPPEPPTTRTRPPSISTSRNNNGKASKTATPISSSFPEPSRPRSGRNSNTNAEPVVKRSHKKGAGLAAQLAAQAAAHTAEDEAESVAGDEGEEDDHEGEPRYCYCNGYSYGEMVACDNDSCAREWFHLECAGLTKPPNSKTKWYCDDCRKKQKMA